jgi:hypothetical protein
MVTAESGQPLAQAAEHSHANGKSVSLSLASTRTYGDLRRVVSDLGQGSYLKRRVRLMAQANGNDCPATLFETQLLDASRERSDTDPLEERILSTLREYWSLMNNGDQ